MGRLQTVARKGYWKEDEAKLVVEAWKRSGCSMRRFSRDKGIHPARLARWVKRLAYREAEEPVFHPVRVVESKETGPTEFVVELGDRVRVRVPSGFQEEDLRRVIVALRG